MKRCSFQAFLLVFASLPLAGSGLASEAWWHQVEESKLPTAGSAVEEVIDHYLESALREREIDPAPEAPPSTLLRRVTLDLNSRIPTVAEVEAFEAVDSPGEYRAIVEARLKDPSFDRYLIHELNWLLMDGQQTAFRDYLERAFAEDKGWDEIFREAVAGIADEEARKGADQFLRSRVRDLDKMTNDVSVRFFGVNVSCAQCHDHPYVQDWTMDTYYGMKGFFGRTFENGGFVGERAYGTVSYKNPQNENVEAKLRFLGGPVIELPESKPLSDEEKKAEKERLQKLREEKKAPPAADDSLRVRLVDAGLEPGSEGEGYFARSLVNRVWNQYFGRGLVMPLDQMHGENLPSHPELLQWLARDLVEHDYDLRRLVRGIVLSQAYRRSSRWDEDQGPRPHAKHFAVTEVRPLNPRQYGVALKIAVSDPSHFTIGEGEGASDEILKRLEATERSGAGLARWFERPTEGFQIAVDEALLFANSPDVRAQLLANGLVQRLDAAESDEERIRLAFRSTLSREPDPEELATLIDYLQARRDRPEQATRQMVWAILASSEARFNH